MFQSFVKTLSHLGEVKELDALLDQYEQTVPDRDVRYIRYCELRSYTLWFRSEFKEAIEWGRIGQKLFESSGADSKFTSNIMHTLALAQRDAGQPELALRTFLDGRQLSDVIDPEELDERRAEHHYGNIGRCLQFMGQVESALICYQKSALLLERSPTTENVLNKAYARTWIGEVLTGRDELGLAHAFLQSGYRLWEQVGPPKAVAVSRLMKEIETRASRPIHAQGDVEKVCLDWILGGNV